MTAGQTCKKCRVQLCNDQAISVDQQHRRRLLLRHHFLQQNRFCLFSFHLCYRNPKAFNVSFQFVKKFSSQWLYRHGGMGIGGSSVTIYFEQGQRGKIRNFDNLNAFSRQLSFCLYLTAVRLLTWGEGSSGVGKGKKLEISIISITNHPWVNEK